MPTFLGQDSLNQFRTANSILFYNKESEDNSYSDEDIDVEAKIAIVNSIMTPWLC